MSTPIKSNTPEYQMQVISVTCDICNDSVANLAIEKGQSLRDFQWMIKELFAEHNKIKHSASLQNRAVSKL